MTPELPLDPVRIERVTTIGAHLAELAYTSGSDDTERIVIALGFLAAAVIEYSGGAQSR